MSNELELFFNEIQKKRISIPNISKELDIPQDRIYQWKASRGKPKVDDFVKIENWINKSLQESSKEKLVSWFLSLEMSDQKRFLKPLEIWLSEGSINHLNRVLMEGGEKNKKMVLESYLSFISAYDRKRLFAFFLEAHKENKLDEFIENNYSITGTSTGYLTLEPTYVEGVEKNDTSHKIPLYENDSVKIEPTNMLDPGDWFSNATGAMVVQGIDMEPKYPNGCIAVFKDVIDKDLIVFGHDYVIETSEYRILKRLQKRDKLKHVIAESYNEQTNKAGKLIYEPFEIPLNKITKLFRVIGKIERDENNI